MAGNFGQEVKRRKTNRLEKQRPPSRNGGIQKGGRSGLTQKINWGLCDSTVYSKFSRIIREKKFYENAC